MQELSKNVNVLIFCIALSNQNISFIEISSERP